MRLIWVNNPIILMVTAFNLEREFMFVIKVDLADILNETNGDHLFELIVSG